MRKLTLQMQTSIDGFVGAADKGVDWMLWSWGEQWPWDDELQAFYNQTTGSIDTVLLGGNTAKQGFINHWTDMAAKKDNSQAKFAGDITNARKVIFSQTMKEARWPNTTIAHGSLTDTVHSLKQQPGKNMIAYGGAGFAASLLNEGLVDKLSLIVNPVVLGEGLSIFKSLTGPIIFTPLSAKLYPCGITILEYGKKQQK